MERMHKTMTAYIKSLSKRNEAEEKEKATPIAQLSSTAMSHADDFEPDSEFGQCLSSKASWDGPAREHVANFTRRLWSSKRTGR